ncbi:hypothetical protein [Novosphingobium sp.]|uniref:hypothetical protein n=1 Tax=Novosphingobium sp. TaxID=1874826 RepID=UPI0026046BE7|nr:hypothetical protein [Novosphingobium sp.]
MKRNNAEALGPIDGEPSGWTVRRAQQAWRRRLADLANACAGAYPEDEGDRIRDAHELLASAPNPTLIAGLAVPPESRIDGMIAAGAPTSAAMALLGEGSGYLLSCGSGGGHLASVVLPGSAQDVSACGDTPALALVGAIATALAAAGAGGTALN